MRVFHNCFIRTSVHDEPTQERGYLVVEAGLISHVGVGKVARRFLDGEMVDLEGQHVMPGFTDSHGHLVYQGEAISKIDFGGCSSTADVNALVEQHIAENNVKDDEWIQGLSLSFPVKRSLFLDIKNPVHIKTADYHGCFCVNIPGMDADPADIEGGSIQDGMFLDRARDVHVRPHLPERDLRALLLVAQQEVLSHGISCVHDAMLTLPMCRAIAALIDERLWILRVFGMLHCQNADPQVLLQEARQCSAYEDYGGLLTVRAVKYFLDGALGSRGALMLQPYSDEPCTRGLYCMPAQRFYESFAPIADMGWQICAHAIGDASNRDCLDAYARYFNERRLTRPQRHERRFRVEHAQHVHQDDVEKFARHGIIASMQPSHLASDAHICLSRVGGARIHRGYRWHSWLSLGVRLCFGSDFPVESPSVLQGVLAAVTRRPLEDDTQEMDYGFQVERERLSVTEAFAAFTEGAAEAVGRSHVAGRLLVGHYADFVVLDTDPLLVQEESARRLLEIRVRRTVVAGLFL